MLAYKIFGLQPGPAEGLLFHSCVQDLQDHPDLWLDECPYLHPSVSPHLLKSLRVELVGVEAGTPLPAVPAPQSQQQALPLAA